MNPLLRNFLDLGVEPAEKMPARSARPRMTMQEFKAARPVNAWGALVRHANIHEQHQLTRVVPFKPSSAHRGADRRAA
jgi:hypothetical protein